MPERLKKFALSAVVIGSFFVAYWRTHHADDEALPPVIPTSSPSASVTSLTPPSPTEPTQPSNSPVSDSVPAAPPSQSATPTVSPTSAPTSQGQYRNGTYTGSVADAFYGNVQVKVTIAGGKITNVQFLAYPNDRSTSVRINSLATPQLASQAIQAQSANVDGVSGASATSEAFRQSLASALAQATP